jgi:hypothetical protein
MRLAPTFVLVFAFACGGSDPTDESGSASAPREPPAEVPRREQEAGLARCGEMLTRMDGPEAAPTFTRLMRECSGLFARRHCRDALGADTFSRVEVAAACRADYCGERQRTARFCTVEMPTDGEFLDEFADFSRSQLRRDLRRIMDREGADEIADLFADLIEAQATRE